MSLGGDGHCVGGNICHINMKLLYSGDKCVEFKENPVDICLPLDLTQQGPATQGVPPSSGGAANLFCRPGSAVMEERLLGPSVCPQKPPHPFFSEENLPFFPSPSVIDS